VRRLSPAWLLLAAAMLALLAAFAFTPLFFVLRSARFAELEEPGAREALANTLILGLAVVAIAVPVGTVLAWLIERTDVLPTDRLRTTALALFAIPVAIPPYLLGIAWVLLGNGQSGLLNRAGRWLDLYGLDGMVLVLATSSYPFALLAVRAALLRADPSLEEAARVSGAGPRRVLTSVTLPLVLPAIAAAAGLVFMFTVAGFGVPYLFGTSGTSLFRVLTTRIYQLVTLGGEEMLERAAALAIVLLAVSALAQLAADRIARRRSTVQVSGKTARPSLVRLGSARLPIRLAMATFALAFIALPIATIVWTSLIKTFADPTALTIGHWRAVLSRAETLRAFSHSVALAIGAGTIVAMTGLLIARIARIGGLFGRTLASAAAAPYSVPGTVLAIGLILAFALELRLVLVDRLTFALHLPGTLWMLLVAYAVKHLAFGVRGVGAALEQIHPSLEEAARTCGAGSMRAFRDVIFPLIAPAAIAAFLIVALTCLSELTMSVLLFGARTETAGTLLFELQSYSDPPAAAVVATLVVITAIAGDALVRALEKRRR
jgi:iron(III) transport system permease protein